MFGSILSGIKNAVSGLADEHLGKFAADKDFLEGVMAAAAMIAGADGEVEAKERAKVGQFITSNAAMKHFDNRRAIDLFTKYASEFDFDVGMGQDTCLKEIREVKGDEKRVLTLRLAIAIAKSDGEFEPEEKVAAGLICDALSLPRSEFGL